MLNQAYSTLAFTLKWPHVAVTVVPHAALCLDNMDVSFARGQALCVCGSLCVLAHACVFVCEYVLLTSCGDKMCAICAHRRFHTLVHV